MSNVAKLKKKAAEFEQKKQIDKALVLYNQVLDQMGDGEDSDISLYNRVGDLTLRHGDVAGAVAHYEKAVDLYTEGGFFNNAIALCNKILRTSPGRSLIYYKLGQISARKGFTSDAKQNFLEYADRMQHSGQLDEAFRALKEFADLCPDQDDIRLMLAEQLTKQGRKAEAMEQLQTLYSRYEADGRKVEARATIERMKAIDPDAEPSGKAVRPRQKSSDLVFLDLDDHSAPAARESRRVETPAPPPRKPSPIDDLPLIQVDEVEESAPEPGLEVETTAFDAVETTPAEPLPEMETTAFEAVETTPAESMMDLDFPDGFSATADTEEAGEVAEPIELAAPEGFEPAVRDDVLASGSEADMDDFADEAAATLSPSDADDSEGLVIGGDLEFLEVSDEPASGAAEVDDDDSTSIGPELDFIMPDESPGQPPSQRRSSTEMLADLVAPFQQEEEAGEGGGIDFGGIELETPRDDASILGGIVDEEDDQEIRTEPAESPFSMSGMDAGTVGFDMGTELHDELVAESEMEVVEPAPRTTQRASSSILALSVEALAERLRRDQNDLFVRRQLAEALLDRGDREEGMQELETTMIGYERAGDIDEARSIADEIIRLDPNSVRHHQKRVEYAFRANDQGRLIQAYLGLADAMFRGGQGEKARTIYQRVLELSPDDVRAQAALSSFMETVPEEEEPPPSIEPTPPRTTSARPRASSAGISTRPAPVTSGSDDDFVNLGDWLRDDEDPKSTRMVVDEEAPSGNEEADFADMLKKFKRGIAENVEEEDHESHYDLGVAFKEMGLLDEAIAEFQKALRGASSRIRTYEALGQCFIEQAQYPVAAAILGRALADSAREGDEQLVGVLYLLGIAAEAMNKPADALGYFHRVFMVDIQFRDVSERISALEQVTS